VLHRYGTHWSQLDWSGTASSLTDRSPKSPNHAPEATGAIDFGVPYLTELAANSIANGLLLLGPVTAVEAGLAL
jgi:hypothetical protein